MRVTDPERLHMEMNPFLAAYIEAALWSSSSDEESFDDYSIWDVDPESLEFMRRDCERFQLKNAADLEGIDDGKVHVDGQHESPEAEAAWRLSQQAKMVGEK